MEEAIYMVIMKYYFTREGSILLLASKNEFCATNVNGFQCKATKSSFSDVAGILDPRLLAVLGKK